MSHHQPDRPTPPITNESPPAALAQVRLFGDLTIRAPALGAAPLDLGSPTTRSLFAYLLLHSDRPADRRQLALLFWPDAPEPAARRNLRQYLHRLRRGLEPLTAAEELVLVEGSSVQLNPQAAFDVDVWRFEELLAAANQPTAAAGAVMDALHAAVALYRGDLLADLFDDWCQAPRLHARHRVMQALEQLADLHYRRRDFAGAIAAAEQLLRLEPWHEAAHARLMAFYYLSGARGQALQQYQRCRQALADELGAAPLPATTAMAAEMRAGAWQETHASSPPFNALPPGIPNGPGIEASAGLPQGSQAPNNRLKPPFQMSSATTLGIPALPPAAGRKRSPVDAAPLPRQPPAGAPFVGRTADLAALTGRLAHAQAGRGSMVLVEGESGIGKTRLLQEAWWQSGQALALLSGHSREFETMTPFHPLVDALRSGLAMVNWAWFTPPPAWLAPVAGLLPEMAARFPTLSASGEAGAEHGDLQHMLEALGRFLLSLAERRPLMLLLEDVQWADQPTWRFLAYLARRCAGASLLVSLTCQPELLNSEQAPIVRGLQRQGWLTRLPLARLSHSETVQLVAALDPDLRLGAVQLQRLYEETEGNPLFVVETVQALHETGTEWLLPHEPGGRRSPFALPLRVQNVIEARLDRLSDGSRQLLGIAAAIGRAFSFSVLQEVSEQPAAEVISSLEAWLRRGLVIERPESGGLAAVTPRYDFSHAQIRTVTYNEMSRARRRWVHRRVAEVLAAASLDRDLADAATLAYHFSQSDAPLQALPYLIAAGEQALQARSYASAREWGLQAVGLLQHAPPAEQGATRIDLNLQLATAYSFTHELARAQTILAETERLAAGLDDHGRLGKVYQRTAQVLWLQGQPGLAAEAARRSQRMADAGADAELQTAALRMLARTAIATGAFDDAIVTLKRYLELAQPPSAHPELALICGYLGVAWARVGSWQRAEQECRRGVALAEAGGNSTTLTVARMQLAFVQAARRDYAGCLATLRPVLPGCEESGLSPHCFMAANLWGRATCALDGLEAGQPYLTRALAWANETGYRVFFHLTHLFLAEAHLAAGQAATASAWAQQALDLARAAGDRWAAGVALRLLGDALARQPAPDWPAVEQALIASLDLLRQIRARPDLARTYLSLRRLYDRTGQMAWAVDCHFRATSIFDELGMSDELRDTQGVAVQTGRPAAVIPDVPLQGPHAGLGAA